MRGSERLAFGLCGGSVNDLANLKKLIGHVQHSANHVLMISRSTLERPYVLCELVYAFKQKKKMLCVRVDWPGNENSADSKAFCFPRHLDETIADWEDVAYFQRARAIVDAIRAPTTVNHGRAVESAACPMSPSRQPFPCRHPAHTSFPCSWPPHD